MYRRLLVILVAFLVLGMGWRPPEPPETIRDAVYENYPDGNVLIGGNFESLDCLDIINREFGNLTSGNAFKQLKIHPKPDVWDFFLTDRFVQNTIDNNQTYYIHSPIGPQCSAWAKDDSRTADELETNLREFVEVVASYYSQDALYMEVVNETVIKGEWFGPKPGSDSWENPWTIIGFENNGVPKYIKIAFEVAMENASTDCKLVWNQHEKLDRRSWELIFDTILWLRSEGIRIDAIGWHAHLNAGEESLEGNNLLRELISTTHLLGMDFIVTELDVSIRDIGENPTIEQLQAQADTYKAVLDIVLEFKDTGTVGVSFWSTSDKCTWKPQYYPGLFDYDGEPKPSYDVILDTLRY